MNLFKIATIAALVSSLGACSMMDRLASVGEAPTLTAINNPTTQAGYRPVAMPMPEIVPAAYQPNSLFSSGAKGFFKDARARRVGDILTVEVTISDSAKIANKTARSRSSTSDAGVSGVLGSIFDNYAPKELGTDASIGTDSGISDTGNGSVNRSESLSTSVAAVVTQVLPNGNLVIEGRQEVRVNFEVRDLIIAGIVRPEDVGNNNTIASSKIAEARIAYGGRGQITDVQQPRYGAQVMDAILPF
ncbi:flagellar basal body L-ring protein FlgH [Mariluticola halotolerans]|uniref:flagellar basal body L-ring protein FlgH n=1 Tax=Mariluticola halotolerans TaxID=2909283 RepID=UPI0026E302B5|nr:flagellar basal body L-ring protein FlgH [Mariluticola halotolerans]UJQ95419.1 flagellar basal body L-ring protein FlgH [Mariluticola halotolerans]